MSAIQKAIDELPRWIVWTQRKGANLDMKALKEAALARGLVGRVCGWCCAPLKGRRTVWCCDAHRERFYAFAIWMRLRDVIFERDEGRCQRCGRQVGFLAESRKYVEWEVDHVTRVCDGGTDHPENLRLLCRKPCHIEVGYEQRAARKEICA
jgi:5-methylcytosine-specific restriction endonuclease McrA